ncbi:hypothetical protein SKAU_G00137790 [Synaphobranchus kaupii]|uniref:Uncharacterized protein n=1 Tax=Synaphobranchus kaupii TaxID=118154 RepID=A0A9Q1FRV0_SYNKA|nr:hypothetical protein SKAU_G00137790 [Synaphobranchus kaupii]
MPSSPPSQFSARPLPDVRQSERGRRTAPVPLVHTPTSRMPSSPMRRISATLPKTNLSSLLLDWGRPALDLFLALWLSCTS